MTNYPILYNGARLWDNPDDAEASAAASALEEAGLHRVTSYGGRVKLATRYRRHEPMGDWEILGPESVNVELRYLTAAQAAEVAHLVAGWGE